MFSLYDPPSKPPRPFEADYPAGAAADATGRLLADIEGRPLVARTVVGRRVVGGPEEALSPEGAYALAESLTGTSPKAVAGREIGGGAGRLVTTTDRRSGQVLDRQILTNRALTALQEPRAIAHETGHVIADIAGVIPTAGLVRDLDQIYSTLADGRLRPSNLTRPKHFGYSDADAPRELMAEAIRAYLADPNYLKTVAPSVAARIRGAVNNNPESSPHIQFNAVAPMPFDPLSSSHRARTLARLSVQFRHATSAPTPIARPRGRARTPIWRRWVSWKEKSDAADAAAHQDRIVHARSAGF